MHLGAVIVTEPVSGIHPLEPGEHLVVSSADSIPHAIETPVGGVQRLARLCSAGYKRLSIWDRITLPVVILPSGPCSKLGRVGLSPALADLGHLLDRAGIGIRFNGVRPSGRTER
jgi:hypothetical protein